MGSNGTTDFPSLKLESPKYLFDVSLSKTNSSPSKGLLEYGPYDFGKFLEVSHPKKCLLSAIKTLPVHFHNS